jgi:hypothetical protein
VVLAAWWLDRLDAGRATLARPDQGAIETLVETLRSRLVLSNAETDALLASLATREALLAEFADAAHARRVRLIAQRGFDAALDLLAGDAPEEAARWRSVGDRELPSRRLPAPIVDGAALVALGFRPGPRFKPLLDAALDAQIEGRISDAASGAEFIRSATAGDRGL